MCPLDRDGSFETKIVQKRTEDLSAIEHTIYARGISQWDITETIEGYIQI